MGGARCVSYDVKLLQLTLYALSVKSTIQIHIIYSPWSSTSENPSAMSPVCITSVYWYACNTTCLQT
ncbi:hypothetical protein DPMN_133875 [Dreissena polymorpha]|uniref:Uncharacterized protein n=1 Tax=Dreissena polymorpha TaxID=45954 RepID=A0A9D4FYR1_DREPO|nr:hypothetical protein DPMN_133875 [Dreissena polymorpha]